MLLAVGERGGDHPDRAFYGQAPYQASDRKLILFVAACAWAGYAKGVISSPDPEKLEALAALPEMGEDIGRRCHPAGLAMSLARAEGEAADRRRKAEFLRDIIGNPWKPAELPMVPSGPRRPGMLRFFGGAPVPVTGGFVICPWRTPMVLSLAQGAYEERMPDGTLRGDALAVLVDALQDAGCPDVPSERARLVRALDACWCDDGRGYQECEGCLENRRLLAVLDGGSDILSHLRSSGPHYRGMWSLDLVLDKT